MLLGNYYGDLIFIFGGAEAAFRIMKRERVTFDEWSTGWCFWNAFGTFVKKKKKGKGREKNKREIHRAKVKVSSLRKVWKSLVVRGEKGAKASFDIGAYVLIYIRKKHFVPSNLTLYVNFSFSKKHWSWICPVSLFYQSRNIDFPPPRRDHLFAANCRNVGELVPFPVCLSTRSISPNNDAIATQRAIVPDPRVDVSFTCSDLTR